MGFGFVGGDCPDQAYLLPPDVRDWLPARHLAWALLEETGRMDLSAFTCWYRADGQGRPAYHPAMMVALLGYCYCKGIRSSRAIEAATFDDVGARVICGNLHPDHATAARFIARHEQAVRGLLVASVMACAREGLVTVDVVAGDGTRVRASASMAANATLEVLDAQIAGLEELVAAEVDAWIAQARAEDALFGDAGGGDGGGARPPGAPAPGGKRLAATLARRREARARLEGAEQARRQEAEAERAERITRLEARAARSRASAERAAAAADRKAQDYQRRAAAKAASGSGRRPDGRAPVSASDSGVVRTARQAAERAAGKLARGPVKSFV